MNEDNIKSTARDYIERELPIIPICSHDHSGMSEKHKKRCKSPGKSPILQRWTSKSRTSVEELEQWFTNNPYINIGLVLGQSDNWNIIGVDIDGELGKRTWDSLVEEYGAPDTWTFITGGGGLRLLYQLPDGVETKKTRIFWEKDSHEEVAFLAQGQQTIMPPSRHSSGNKYEWVIGKSPYTLDIAMAPQWIIDKVSIEATGPEELPNFFGKTLSRPVTALEYNQSTYEGSRSNSMARFVGSLCAKRELPKETILATAMQQNLLYCQPPLEESDIVAMVDSIWQAEQTKHEQRLQKQRQREEMSAAALAELFFKEQLNKGIHWRYYSDRQTFYRTELSKGPWEQQTQDQLEMHIQRFILQQDPSRATSNVRKEVIGALRLYLMHHFGDGSEFDVGRNPNLKFIAVPNGLLDWQKGELKPWDPKFRHTTNISAKWNPEARNNEAYKKWLAALRSWLPDEDTVMFLQEYIGYALLPSCKMRTAVFLYGEGANGKSLFIDVVQMLFEDSYAVAQPTSLTGRFGTTSLIDKMLIVCSDIDSSYLDKTGVLKQIIAGDEIRGEYKGGKDFWFTPVGKMLFSANSLPRSADRSYGWYSRLQFVPFPNRFRPNQQYYNNLMTVMNSEEGRSALLAWAVEGLQRLTINGEFTISKLMEDSKKDYRKDNDSVVAFADEFIEPHPIKDGGYKTALVLRYVYQVYKEWCDAVGVKPVSQHVFSSRITELGYERKTLRYRDGNKWKSATSLVDTIFAQDTEFQAESVYKSYARIAL